MLTLQQIIDENPEAETFRFGDSRALCDEILALVRAGKKTATCEAARHYGPSDGSSGYAWPEVGRRDIALDWDGNPALMIETVAVETRRWSGMDAEFVTAQGEFRDLADWQVQYRRYFERTGGWSADMKIMCERFRMVVDYGKP